jgi:hypothetical protein
MKKHKGISTFIATLLLMVLAVSAGVVIYAYTMGYLGGFGGTEQLGAISIDTSEGYSTNSTHAGNFTAYIRNIGKSTVNITTAYVDGTLSEIRNATSPPYDDHYAVWIEEGDVKLVVVVPDEVQAGHTYEIKLIAEDNTQVSFSVKAD